MEVKNLDNLPQAVQSVPPQSVPVSSPFITPSVQVAMKKRKKSDRKKLSFTLFNMLGTKKNLKIVQVDQLTTSWTVATAIYSSFGTVLYSINTRSYNEYVTNLRK